MEVNPKHTILFKAKAMVKTTFKILKTVMFYHPMI